LNVEDRIHVRIEEEKNWKIPAKSCMCDDHRITFLLKSRRLPTTTLACLLCNVRLLLGYPLACCAVSLAVCMSFAIDVDDRCGGAHCVSLLAISFSPTLTGLLSASARCGKHCGFNLTLQHTLLPCIVPPIVTLSLIHHVGIHLFFALVRDGALACGTLCYCWFA
jgi:hypothetical protein